MGVELPAVFPGVEYHFQITLFVVGRPRSGE